MKTTSRRKNIAILSLVVLVILLPALFILIGGRDQLAEVTEDSGSMDNTDYQWIRHRFEKGSELSLNISASKTALGDGSYQLMIIVNQENSTDYEIASLNASLSSSTETQFLNALVGKDGGEYGVPDVSYDGNTKIQRFDGDHYLYYSAIVTDSEPIPEMELTLRYRIEGKNRYFLNKFYNNTATLTINFPEPDEPDPPQENEETNPVTNEEEDGEVVAVAISDTSPIDRFPESAEPDPPQETEEPNPAPNEDETAAVSDTAPIEPLPQETEEPNPAPNKEGVAPVAIHDTSIKEIPELYAGDYLIADDGIGVYYANVSGEPSWQGHLFTKGELFGEILSHTEERELSKIEPWSANVLPIGTKLYRANEEKIVILAETDGTLIPYLKIVEG